MGRQEREEEVNGLNEVVREREKTSLGVVKVPTPE